MEKHALFETVFLKKPEILETDKDWIDNESTNLLREWPLVYETSRERPKSVPYLRLKI